MPNIYLCQIYHNASVVLKANVTKRHLKKLNQHKNSLTNPILLLFFLPNHLREILNRRMCAETHVITAISSVSLFIQQLAEIEPQRSFSIYAVLGKFDIRNIKKNTPAMAFKDRKTYHF